MTRSFGPICIDHDPAFEIDDGGWPRAKTAAEAFERGKRNHPDCAILVGEWSGGLVAVHCPGSRYPGEEPHQVESAWLRLLALAPADLRSAAKVARVGCWDYHTAQRLRQILDIFIPAVDPAGVGS